MKILLCGKVELEWKKKPGCPPTLAYITPYFDQDNCPISPVKTYCPENEEWDGLIDWIKELDCGGGGSGNGEPDPDDPTPIEGISIGKGLERHGCVYDTTDPENPICKGTVFLCHKTIASFDADTQTTTTENTATLLYVSTDGQTIIDPYDGSEGPVEKCKPETQEEECEPYIDFFAGDSVPTDQEFHSIGVEKPKCCTVIVTTTAGRFRVGPDTKFFCPEAFRCPVKFIEMEVTGPEGADCTKENVTVTLQKLA